MLRLPLPTDDLVAGCNFAITQVLTSVVSGASTTLYQQRGRKGRLFKEVLRNVYPWSLEIANGIKAGYCAEVVYTLFRNPLTHELGLDPKNKPKGQKIIVKRLATGNNGLPENKIEQLETDIGAVTPSATITIEPDRIVLLVERFYWGVRTMIEKLSNDHVRMASAEAFLKERRGGTT